MQEIRPLLGREGVERLEELALLGEMDEPCPYLPDQTARFRFLDGRFAGNFYRELMDFGHRRNGLFIYRPVCAGCNACEVLRVPLRDFKRNKEQRRIWNRGLRTFQAALVRPEYSDERAALYRRYLREVHGSLRDTPENSHYSQFLVQSCIPEHTCELQFRDGDRLVAVTLIDLFGDALSSVYAYYDPDYARYSPGTYSALTEIALGQRLGLAYYYPGYYIADCRSMRYKARFRPCELRRIGEDYWFPFTPDPAGKNS